MKNMKMDEEEAKEYSPSSMASDAPEYPYGLQISLDDSSLEKLGLDKLPEVGAEIEIRAVAEVCSVSENKTYEGEVERRVCLQITDMEVGRGSTDAAKELYGK